MTPPRPQLITDPICPQCGGWRRDWLRVHRRHAGFAGGLHRVCCCGCPCQCSCSPYPDLTATLSGVSLCGCVEGLGGDWATIDPSTPPTFSAKTLSSMSDVEQPKCSMWVGEMVETAEVAVMLYSDSGCTSYTMSSYHHLHGLVACIGGVWRAEFYLDEGQFADGRYSVFSGTYSGDICNATINVSNDHEAGDCGNTHSGYVWDAYGLPPPAFHRVAQDMPIIAYGGTLSLTSSC